MTLLPLGLASLGAFSAVMFHLQDTHRAPALLVMACSNNVLEEELGPYHHLGFSPDLDVIMSESRDLATLNPMS